MNVGSVFDAVLLRAVGAPGFGTAEDPVLADGIGAEAAETDFGVACEEPGLFKAPGFGTEKGSDAPGLGEAGFVGVGAVF